MSLYPVSKDQFRVVVEQFEECLATWLADYYAAAVAVETELGVRPAGVLGTIHARLFGTQNISEVNGRWQRITENLYVATSVAAFARNTPHGHEWAITQFSRYAGQTTVWGEDMPAPFFALQTPLKDVSVGATSELIQPWRHVFVECDSERQVVGVVALSGDNRELQNAVGQQPQCALMFWNLYTGGTVIEEL